MDNGFLSNNMYIEYEYGKTYKIPFYHKSNTRVNIVGSDNINIDKFQFDSSIKKQYISFTINEYNKHNDMYLIYGHLAKFKKINIKFKENNMFILNNNEVTFGNNDYIISKKSEFKLPKLILISKNGIEDIEFKNDNNQLFFNINIKTKDNYFLKIKDGIKTKQFKLDWTGAIELNNKIEFDFNIKYKYTKQKIFLICKSNIAPNKDLNMNIKGSLNGDFVWKKGETTKEFIFQKQILKWEILYFNIDNKTYSKMIINKEYFPKKMTKTKTGIRFDKMCMEPLILKIDNSVYNIPTKTLKYDIEWDGKKEFKLYFKDVLLDKNIFKMEKYLPEMFIINNPLKIKLTHKYYEDVIVEFEDYNFKYNIPAGNTEVLINHKNKGIRILEIKNIENATYKKKKWKFFVK